MDYIELSKLIEAHRAKTHIISTHKLTFLGVDGFDVYNISQAFNLKGKSFIAGRVEPRDSELSSVRFFEEVAPYTYQATVYSLPNIQDPSVAFVDNLLLIGGTEIYADKTGKITSWRTVFYQGYDFSTLRQVVKAPLKMKDVRIAKSDKYYLMSRPQGGVAKYGKIGFISANKLAAFTPDAIEKAPLIEDLFGDAIWGGANQMIILKNGWIGVLGHVARMTEGDVRHYYDMTFAFNPKTNNRTAMKIIAERKDFAPGASKRPDLVDVVFAGGLVRQKDKTALLYTGLSDAEAHVALINDPMVEYESLPR
jgi:hypothetical protein